MNDPYPAQGDSAPPPPGAYPVRYDVDYPDRQLNRLTTFFRLFTIIPIAIVLGSVSGNFYVASGGWLLIGPFLMVLFREKYPRWWFDFNQELLRFSARVSVYGALLDDRYPSTDERQSVRLDIDYPEQGQLNRWLPLVKWLLAIPHYVVLFLLGIGAYVAVIIAWFAILFTGRYPRALFDYVVGVYRYAMRVVAYAMILTTDRYPPFRLSP
jgi:hypothetical protein